MQRPPGQLDGLRTGLGIGLDTGFFDEHDDILADPVGRALRDDHVDEIADVLDPFVHDVLRQQRPAEAQGQQRVRPRAHAGRPALATVGAC